MRVNIPETMHAVMLTGYGGFDKLEYQTDIPVPTPDKNEVLIRVVADGVNNTDINEQNTLMNEGQRSQKDIEKHVEAWIAKNKGKWNGWLAEARKAAK